MTTVTQLLFPRLVFYDANAAPLAGGFVYTYVPGGTSPAQTWQDAGALTPNTNPIVLDANGSCLCYGNGNYRIVVTDNEGNQVPAYSGLTASIPIIPNIPTVSTAMAPVVAASTVAVAMGLLANQPVSTNFFQNMGATIDRFNDRVFVGAATVNDGNFPNSTQDWLSAIFTASSSGPTVEISQFASLSTIGGIAVLGASESSTNTTANSEGTIGICGIGINNNTTLTQTSYAGYFEARAESGIVSGSITQCVEMDVANLTGNTPVQVQPYQPYKPGATYNLFVSSGAGIGTGVTDSSLGLLIGNNGAKFDKGIMFDANAITGSNGTTGSGVAIALARGQAMVWYTPAGQEAGFINSTTTTTSPAPISMQFVDTGLEFVNPNGVVLIGINPVLPTPGNTAMFLEVNNNAGPNGVQVSLGGPDSGGPGFRQLIVPN